MDFRNFAYMAGLTAILSGSLFVAFRNRSFSLSKLKYMAPAILMTSALFIFFGIRLSGFGIRVFNPGYLVGFQIFGLPVEELLYLIIFPVLMFAVYEWLKPKNIHARYYNYYIVLSLVLLIALAAAAYFGRKYFYTLMAFLFSATFFGYVFFRNLLKDKYPPFYAAFLISFAAWFLFELLITGLPIVNFDPGYISGIRLMTVPVEEMGSFFLLFLMNISVYEYFSERRFF